MARPRLNPRPRSAYASKYNWYAEEYNISKEGVNNNSDATLKAYREWFDEESQKYARRTGHLTLGEWKEVYGERYESIASQEVLDDIVSKTVKKRRKK